jgi:hypothetical protein
LPYHCRNYERWRHSSFLYYSGITLDFLYTCHPQDLLQLCWIQM